MRQTRLTAEFAAQLLAGIRADLAHWQAADFRASGVYDKSPDRGGARHNRRRNGAQYGEIEVDIPTWLGRNPTGAERRAASNALAALEASGQITRLTGPGGRTVAVRVNLAALEKQNV